MKTIIEGYIEKWYVTHGHKQTFKPKKFINDKDPREGFYTLPIITLKPSHGYSSNKNDFTKIKITFETSEL